ncbi:hypothetical protein NL360_27900, partial [Klebsiella pneumoniae]|nr:hypothetical protein [Klebsiella pneumoniae]
TETPFSPIFIYRKNRNQIAFAARLVPRKIMASAPSQTIRRQKLQPRWAGQSISDASPHPASFVTGALSLSPLHCHHPFTY